MSDDAMERDVAAATAATAYRDQPTKENGVLHAVAVWRLGCTTAPGECDECNNLLLKVLSERLGVPHG